MIHEITAYNKLLQLFEERSDLTSQLHLVANWFMKIGMYSVFENNLCKRYVPGA